MLAHAVHLVDHPPDDSALGQQSLVLHFRPPLSAEVFDEDLINFVPMTLVREVSGTFDDPDQRILTKLSTFDDRLELVVWILVAGNDDARASGMGNVKMLKEVKTKFNSIGSREF